jgi:putative FmdB family regulatory protein
MPMYEYRCRQCGEDYEELRRMQDADRDLKCPFCGAEQIERLLSAFATGGCGSTGGFT